MKNQVYYHTRHIPIEHLKLDEPMGRQVYDNLLCSSLDSPCADRLRDYGIDIVETRLVWNEMEPEEGKYDFSRLDRDIEKIRKNGFGVGVFPWFQHPPKWYADGVRLRCPEHGAESTLLSLWDADRLLAVYDRLYGELAKRYGSVIDFLYVGIYSDYGEVCMPLGIRHYKFSPSHRCPGSFWDADPCAVESRRKALGDDPSPIAYAKWYTDSVMDFTDRVCAVVRKHFPTVRAALPIGCVGEMLHNGQVKSRSAEIAAKYHLTARWTGWCLDGRYDLSHAGTRRVSTAAAFYGADFGLETPLWLNEDTAPHALFEVMTNHAVIVHNDPGNIFRAYAVYKPLRDHTAAEPFVCDRAVFYPLEGEQLGKISFYNRFRLDCAELRRHLDYEVADSRMLRDGYRKELIFTPNVPILSETADFIRRAGLDTVYIEDAPPVVIETGEAFRCGRAVKDWESFGKWNGSYTTRLADRSVVFDTEKNTITCRD